MIKIEAAKTNQYFKKIAELATIIWTEHYTPIIGSTQVAYMLNKFQSQSAIVEQVKSGVEYYMIFYNDALAGYFSIYKEEEALFISKLYVSKNLRGYGLGKSALSFLEKRAQDLGCVRLSLTVNKYNSNSIQAYKKMSFVIMKSIIIDIGNGYVMDDYYLEKELS